MTETEPKVSPDYLSDITGKSKATPIFEALVKRGLLNILPDPVKRYWDDIQKIEDDGIHQYLCHIEQAPKDRDCESRKALGNQHRDVYLGYIEFYGEKPYQLYKIDGAVVIDPARKSIAKTNTNKFAGNHRASNLQGTVLGQGANPLRPKGAFKLKTVDDDAKRDRVNFEKAVNGEKGQSVGTRAVFYNSDGSITTGADNIRANNLGADESSKIPSESINNGDVPQKTEKDTPKKTSKNPKKKPIGKTNDLIGGLAALGGVTALIGLVCMLLPIWVVLDAITFMTSVVTMLTNVNNVVNTFLSVIDSILTLVGLEGATDTIKAFCSEMADNAFGKENVQRGKNAFAKAVNSLSAATKLAEKVASARQSTNGKVDEVALQVGTVNNALGEAGLIPPEMMATSTKIDAFVDTRSTEESGLDEALTDITSEIKSQDKIKEELAVEKEARDKKEAKIAKDVKDLSDLSKTAKEAIKKIDVDDL